MRPQGRKKHDHRACQGIGRATRIGIPRNRKAVRLKTAGLHRNARQDSAEYPICTKGEQTMVVDYVQTRFIDDPGPYAIAILAAPAADILVVEGAIV